MPGSRLHYVYNLLSAWYTIATRFRQVFSANEEVEEIATQMLPLLATDFYQGSLMLKLPFTKPEVSDIHDTMSYTARK